MSLFLTIAVVLGLTALFGYVNERFLGLQQTIGLMVLALTGTLMIGLLRATGVIDLVPEMQAFVTSLALHETLLNGVLCFMLFAGSINVRARILGEERWVILTLAVGATLFAAVSIGGLVWGLFAFLGVGLSLIYALIFGALISPTDPIAALAILGKVGLPPKLEAIINGESLFNDGVGVVVFTICVTIAVGTRQPTAGDAVMMFLREVFGGIALGFAASALMHQMLSRTTDYGNQVLISLSIVALGYALAEHLEVSGPIAMVVTGLVIGNYTMPRLERDERLPFRTFWRAVDEILNSVLFVLIGLHIAVVPLFAPGVPTALCAIVVCLLVRWISVYISLNALSFAGALKADNLGLTNLLTWGGLRGGLAIAMALSLPNGPEKDIILHMTYGVVAFSIIVQGLSIGRIFKADQMKLLHKRA